MIELVLTVLLSARAEYRALSEGNGLALTWSTADREIGVPLTTAAVPDDVVAHFESACAVVQTIDKRTASEKREHNSVICIDAALESPLPGSSRRIAGNRRPIPPTWEGVYTS